MSHDGIGSGALASTEQQDLWVARVLGVRPRATAGGLSLVRLGRSRIEWGGARAAAVTGIGRLRKAVADEFADDAEQAAALVNALSMLDGLIARLDAQLEADLDAVLNAPPGPVQAAAMAAARRTLQDTSALIGSDPLLAGLDGNEILPDLVVRAPLQARLADITAALA